jgi:hypothetical protein
MIKRLSEALGVSPDDLAKQGVLDTFLNVDSQFHIDPALVKSSAVPELAGSYSIAQGARHLCRFNDRL